MARGPADGDGAGPALCGVAQRLITFAGGLLLLKGFGRQSGALRRPKEIALTGVASKLRETIEHFNGLDALCGRVQAKRAAKADNCLHDFGLVRFVEHLGHERAVDLDRIEFERAQMIEA